MRKSLLLLVISCSYLFSFAQTDSCIPDGFYQSKVLSYGEIKKEQKILANQAITSPDQQFQLAINNEQLVVERILEEKICNKQRYVKTNVIWTAPSARRNGWGQPEETSFSIQKDCNMVFSNIAKDYWLATSGSDKNRVILNQCVRGFVTNDGRFVLLNAEDKEIWKSKEPTSGSITSTTYTAPCFNEGFYQSNIVGHGFMKKGQSILKNQSIVSFSGEYQLAINGKEQMVIEKILKEKSCNNTRYVQTEIVWTAPSDLISSWKTPEATSVKLQEDCNLVFGNVDNEFWLITNGVDMFKGIIYQCNRAFVTDNGRLALLDANNKEIWQTAPAPAGSITPYTYIDKSKMIPLSYKQVYNDFAMKLVGGALKDSTYINFDTGSYTTSIPYHLLNKSKIKVIEKNIKDDWGQDADLVQGTLNVKSVDGSITYFIEDYKFFALKKGNHNKIMGAFPALSWRYNISPFPMAIEQKYAKNQGFALVSNGIGQDLERDWSKTKFYMSLGLPNDANKNIRWSPNISTFRSHPFAPDYIGHFKVSITPNASSSTYTTEKLVATIDTGAPELTLRLGKDNPQNREPFKSHFVKEGQWARWNSAKYNASATNFINGKVQITFTDDQEQDFTYSFNIGDNPSSPNKNLLTAGTWEGDVPWKESNETPNHRINLGNSLYYFAPVFFYDRVNKRVGFGFLE